MKDKMNLGAVIAHRELNESTTGATILISVGTPQYPNKAIRTAARHFNPPSCLTSGPRH